MQNHDYKGFNIYVEQTIDGSWKATVRAIRDFPAVSFTNVDAEANRLTGYIGKLEGAAELGPYASRLDAIYEAKRGIDKLISVTGLEVNDDL